MPIETNDQHIIKEELSPPPILRGVGLLVALGGFIALFEVWQIGIIAIVGSMPFFIPKRFREIDLRKQVHRVGLSFGKYQQGKWKPLPTNINYISVMRLKQKSTIHTAVGISAQSSTNIYVEYQVNLICDKRNTFKVGIADSLEEAIRKADQCSNYLQNDVIVIQPGKKYWRRYSD